MSDQKKKTLWTLSGASFLNDFGSDMIYPLWPVFVTSVLDANMTVLGFIDGLGDALVSISQAVSGYLSDRFKKRKIFIWLGYLFGSVSRIGYAFSTAWQHLIPFRVLDRAGKMRGAPRDAIIADISTDSNRGGNFGLLRAMDNLGAVCGIIASIVLFGFLGYRRLFLLAAIPSLIGAALIILNVDDSGSKKIYRGFSFKNLSRDYKVFLLLSSVFALGWFSYSFLLISAKDAGFNVTTIPILYLIFTVVASATSIYFGRLADRIGRRVVLGLSFILFGLMCLGFMFLENTIAIVILFALYGLHLASIEPVRNAMVSEFSTEDQRATMLGTYRMVVGVLALPASLIAGLLWESIGHWAPFMFSFLMCVIATFLLSFIREPRPSAS